MSEEIENGMNMVRESMQQAVDNFDDVLRKHVDDMSAFYYWQYKQIDRFNLEATMADAGMQAGEALVARLMLATYTEMAMEQAEGELAELGVRDFCAEYIERLREKIDEVTSRRPSAADQETLRRATSGMISLGEAVSELRESDQEASNHAQ